MYQKIDMKTQHLACYRHDDGNEFYILLSPNRMQCVDLGTGELEAYTSEERLDEYDCWKQGRLGEVLMVPCSLIDYVKAQNKLLRKTAKGRPCRSSKRAGQPV